MVRCGRWTRSMGAVTSTSRQRPNDHHGNAPARAIVLAILRRRVHEELATHWRLLPARYDDGAFFATPRPSSSLLLNSQSGDRPDKYREPRRFETTPSKP